MIKNNKREKTKKTYNFFIFLYLFINNKQINFNIIKKLI